MVWYINFCAPFLPNDPVINFHRYFQVATLAVFTLICAVIHTYYKFWGPPPLQQQPEPNQKEEQQAQPQEDTSEVSSSVSHAISIKMEEMPNDSCAELKKTDWERSTFARTITPQDIVENVTVGEIQSYFPMVYGHFAIAVGLSTMYTPYFQQSVACLVCVLLSIPLAVVNSKRHNKCLMALWIIMLLMMLFLLGFGLLEVGQSTWDPVNSTCFPLSYVSIYD